MKPAPIEQAVVAHLAAVTGKPASTKVPTTRPSEFFRVSLAGGDKRNMVMGRPLLIIESWADDQGAALRNANDAWAALNDTDRTDLPLGVCVMEVSYLSLPVNTPDAASGVNKYQFNYQPTVVLEGL